MEELNKSQIVLLTLLVSFVTSIATGIVTVSLMDQAPVGVTQTINRVVERTIEKVVPGEVKTTTVVKEVPVIVTEEQLIMDVINQASPATVRVINTRNFSGNENVGTGFIVTEQGIVATAEQLLPLDVPANSWAVILKGGQRIKAERLSASNAFGVALLQLDPADLKTLAAAVAAATSTSPEAKSFSHLNLADGSVLLGQTVVALGLPDNGPINVAGGIVSGMFTASTSTIDYIKTNAVNQTNLGGPLLNIKGKVIGLNKDLGLAVTADMVRKTIATLKP